MASIVLEEKEFRTRDISTQIYAVFERMAIDRKIKLAVDFEGPHDSNTIESSGVDGRRIYGPFGTGRVKDMIVWGDKTRILQVVINLTSNALKFTREGGSVKVVIRCVGDVELTRKESFNSRNPGGSGSGRNSRARVYSNTSEYSVDRDSERGNSVARGSSRSSSPPPNSRELIFEFEVQDTGVGVPALLQDRIFEPFFQGDMQLTKKYSGTGLGLSICRQLATLMHGSIELKSEEGKGSTFTMRIPLKQVASRAGSTASSISDSRPSPRGSMDQSPVNTVPSQPAGSSSQGFPGPTSSVPAFEGDTQPRLVGLSAPFFAAGSAVPGELSPEPSELGGRKLRILIAEDNKTNQMVVLRMLRMEKIYNVDVAEGKSCYNFVQDKSNHTLDGKQAVDLVKEAMKSRQEYDLIFMDVQMPNMDGLEATRLIRKAGFKRPIVALSAYSDDTNVRSCHESGMDDFVSKPIQMARLKLVLKTFCPNEETTTPAASSTAGPSSAGKERSGRPLSGGAPRTPGSPSSLRKEAPVQREALSDRVTPEHEDVSPLSSPPLP
jgi:osomolarity two-component system, sensor histidine kinase SLN1